MSQYYSNDIESREAIQRTGENSCAVFFYMSKAMVHGQCRRVKPLDRNLNSIVLITDLAVNFAGFTVIIGGIAAIEAK